MKKLSSFTIIPDELYVERGADAQLRQVINDMGRPAYVLVARQMGKTNLLLHAKKTTAMPGDLFVYIDVSNPVETLDEFFNAIVDAMLDTGLVHEEITNKIYKSRNAGQNFSAHRVHERELRYILNSISGKIVIFLDEVDALRNRQYSDQVFAYIRSVYFAARTNFPEFNRLSYVLSGVGEPSELIKNKDISPFNIGQKIYLDDFGFTEFSDFCVKTGLNLDSNIIERVYFWAQGNPRISWDLLSAVEDRINSGKQLNSNVVDVVANELYLEMFDLPPIDHIRNLVEKDAELQAALVAMHYGKSESVSSHEANKLYLAGITKPDDNGRGIIFRNKVIAESLTLGWLLELESKQASPISRAYEAFQQRRWSDALVLLTDCFETSDEVTRLRLAVDIASCKFRCTDYERAVEWIELHLPKKHLAALEYYEMLYWLGMSNFSIGNSSEAFKAFQAASEEAAEGVNPYFYECLTNCCAHHLQDWKSNSAAIEEIIFRILNNQEKLKEAYKRNTVGADHVRCSAYWNLATLRKRQGNLNEAINFLEKAREINDRKFIVGISLEISRLHEDRVTSWNVSRKMADSLVEDGYVLEQEEALYHLAFTSKNASELLAILALHPEDESFFKFLNYLKNLLQNQPLEMVSVLAHAANSAVVAGAINGAAILFKTSYEIPVVGLEVDVKRTYAASALVLGRQLKFKELENSYFSEYLLSADAEILATDIYLVFSAFYKKISTAPNDAYELLKVAQQLFPALLSKSENSQSHESIRIGELILDVCEIEWNILVKDSLKAVSLGIAWLDRVKNLKVASPPPAYFPENILQNLSERVQKITFSHHAVNQYIRGHQKLGRNSIVTVVSEEGIIKKGKYKKFEADVKTGLLRIVED